MLLAVGGEPRSVTGLVPQDITPGEQEAQDVSLDKSYWDSPSNAKKGNARFCQPMTKL